MRYTEHEYPADKLLDALIAQRFFGYRWRKSSVTGRRCIYVPDCKLEHMQELASGNEPLVGDWESHDWTPRYSRDMTAAFKVVDSVRSQAFSTGLVVGNLQLTAYCYNRTYATLINAAENDYDDERWSEANGTFATPHAICLAALTALDYLNTPVAAPGQK